LARLGNDRKALSRLDLGCLLRLVQPHFFMLTLNLGKPIL
jgi:hypothetical protein